MPRRWEGRRWGGWSGLSGSGRGRGKGKGTGTGGRGGGGRGGPAVSRARGAPTLRDVRQGLGDARVRVETEDARVLIDLDTPDDFEAWRGHRPGFVGAGRDDR